MLHCILLIPILLIRLSLFKKNEKSKITSCSREAPTKIVYENHLSNQVAFDKLDNIMDYYST